LHGVSLELYTVNDIVYFSVIFIPFTELVVFNAYTSTTTITTTTTRPTTTTETVLYIKT